MTEVLSKTTAPAAPAADPATDTAADPATDTAATDAATEAATNAASDAQVQSAPDAAAREHAAWHAARERELRSPHGWLSPTALLWPTAKPGRLPGLPGEWWVADRKLFTRPVPGDTVVLTGEHVEPEGPTAVGVAEGRSRIIGTFLPEGRDDADDEHEVAVEVVLRTGRYGIRPRDPQAATRTGFDGVPAFGYDPDWVLDVPVRWYDEPEPITVGAAQPRLVHHVEVFGEVDIARDGTVTTLALTGSLTEPALLFTDEADGVAPWRILRITAPDVAQDSALNSALNSALDPDQDQDQDLDPAPATSDTLRLDLNRAVNLPYAFTDFGTCPAPASGNHLPFAVTAGEKAPR
ncbi:hypothetical protein C8K30_10745 [Promicromonospora sp. AC04]|uniref:DUF1684 domain-containing protein n=1 Tax=Promicromonospora sp. AC04 TaxID=2135723 RepID=UPI000D3877C6|nr:DUF1684 domain-containing protein [Promicromonospora sp. AC04]PUB25301.1 hypothetical protein C8K30_10745 [Promicromonospora sp. AC04]